MALFIIRSKISGEETAHQIQGSFGLFTCFRVSQVGEILATICPYSCQGRECFSRNPGCKRKEELTKAFLIIKGTKYWRGNNIEE